MYIVYKKEDGKKKVDKIIHGNGFQILPNIEGEKFFAAKLGDLLCVDLDSYTENNELWYRFELTNENLPEKLSDDELYYDYLLFENLGNGQIREIISGVVFNASFVSGLGKDYFKGNEIFESSRSVVDIQNNRDFEKILTNPLGIWINASTYNLDELVDNYLVSKGNESVDSELLEGFEGDNDFAYKFDDNFKYYYSEKILPKKDLIIETLTNAETIARRIVKERIEKEINKLHGIALTENEIYDYEQKNPRR